MNNIVRFFETRHEVTSVNALVGDPNAKFYIINCGDANDRFIHESFVDNPCQLINDKLISCYFY